MKKNGANVIIAIIELIYFAIPFSVPVLVLVNVLINQQQNLQLGAIIWSTILYIVFFPLKVKREKGTPSKSLKERNYLRITIEEDQIIGLIMLVVLWILYWFAFYFEIEQLFCICISLYHISAWRNIYIKIFEYLDERENSKKEAK